MIRRAIATSVAAAFMALALPQATPAQSVYLLAGLSVPSGDYGDLVGTGWLGAAGVTFPVGEAGLWVGAEGLYGGNSSDFDGPGAEDGSIWSVMGVVGYDIPTESTISPYLFGGLGLMGIDLGFTDSGFGWQLGGGVAFAGEGNITPFVEGRFQSATLQDDFDEDGTASIFGIEAGVSIGLGDN